MDNFIKATKTFILEVGVCSPMIFVEGTKGSDIISFSSLGDSSAKRIQILYLAGEKSGREENVGKLVKVCFVNEGWMAIAHNGKFTRPSQDPDKIETLLFSCLDVSNANKQTIQIFKMVRNLEGKLINLFEYHMTEAVEVKSELLPAFVAGYLSTGIVSS